MCTPITVFTQCSKSGTWQLSCLLYVSVRMIQGFFYEKMLHGELKITLLTEVSRAGNEETFALILSNVHKRTPAPDCSSFRFISLFTPCFSSSMAIERCSGSPTCSLSCPPPPSTVFLPLGKKLWKFNSDNFFMAAPWFTYRSSLSRYRQLLQESSSKNEFIRRGQGFFCCRLIGSSPTPSAATYSQKDHHSKVQEGQW